MALSMIDRLLIERSEEAMRNFTLAEFRKGFVRGRTRATMRCPVPGCKMRTRGGCCRRHWRHKAKYRGHSNRR